LAEVARKDLGDDLTGRTGEKYKTCWKFNRLNNIYE